MHYGEKFRFRDFMVGWLVLQRDEPDVNNAEIEALYNAIVCAEDDQGAYTEVEKALSDWAARMLWGLSERWDDPTIALAEDLIEALRNRVSEDFEDPTIFYLFFLNPFKTGRVPDSFEETIEQTISWLFWVLYSAVADTVLIPYGWESYVVVEPSYEDVSNIIILAHPKQALADKVFILQNWYDAWNLRFESLTDLAEELLRLRQAIEQSTAKTLMEYGLVGMLTEPI